MLALVFDTHRLAPAVAIGVADASLYGLLAMALVLTFRISRTVAFVHYGFAVVGGLGYWILVFPTNYTIAPGHRPHLPPIAALIIMTGVGALLGALYGLLVTDRRLARLPRLTLTIVSLSAMLLLAGFMTDSHGVFGITVNPSAVPKAPFGQGGVRVPGTLLADQRVGTLILTVLLMVATALWLNRTRAGLSVRAIADDVEASLWSGINLPLIGTIVYAGAGAMATLAGTLLVPLVGADPFSLLFVFLRALFVAVIGGFRSMVLAVAGAVLVSVVDSMLRSGVFGDQKPGVNEVILLSTVLIAVLFVGHMRRQAGLFLEAEAL